MEGEEKKKKNERRRSHSRADSKDSSRHYSRDIGDKGISQRDDSSRSRKRHADYYDSNDRHSNRSHYGDRSNRHHSHHHRHRHSYSSDSSTERHSYKRKRRSSSTDKHKSRRDDKRKSSSSGKRKKKRRHHPSSSSSSPTTHRSESKSKRKDKDLKQAPDEALQEELVNLETQISMDKKMLLKNLLRKERLELLHESLESEQCGDDTLINSDDNKLKEELQQLDDAIATGKNALIKVMKRIGSTDSGRNSEQ